MTPTRPISLETVSRPACGGPNTPRERVLKSLVLFAIVAATTLAAAAPGRPGGAEEKKKTTKGKSGPAAVERVPVWPLPPEPARIRYVTSYRGAEDFNTKKKSAGWKALVFGQDDAGPARPDALVKPYGVATSPSGLIYVSDTAARRVFVFDAERRTVTFVGDRQPASLAKPIGIAVDAAGTVFVADATLQARVRLRARRRPGASPSATTASSKPRRAWRSTATASCSTWPTPRSTRCSATRPWTAPPSGPSAAAAASPASSTSRRTSPSTARGGSTWPTR